MKVGALWIREKDGKKFMSGTLQWPGVEMHLAVFKNESKQGQQPDYEIVWYPQRKGGVQPSDREDFGNNVPF